MSPRVLTDAEVRQYHEDGYVLAKGFFDAEEIGLLHHHGGSAPGVFRPPVRHLPK